jgi:hypothetical protein
MESKIFYLAYDHAVSGGERHVYDHVDLLNKAGFDAYVLHTEPGYRHTWFPNSTRAIDFRSLWTVYDERLDYLVLPEPSAAVDGTRVVWIGQQNSRPVARPPLRTILSEDVAVLRYSAG